MKVLVLEDDILRIDTFKNKLNEVNLTIVHHADDAIKLLKENVYDIVFLDHDLDGGAYISTNVYNTGSTVARNMHNTLNTKTPIVIHSWNPVGAEYMEKVMTDNNISCCRFPFGTNEFNSIVDRVIVQHKQNRDKT